MGILLDKSNKFLNNPCETKEDVRDALRGLLDPLAAHTSPGKALLTLSTSGTHYDLLAAQLEAFARPLWGLAALLKGGGEYDGVKRWCEGLGSGTKPGGVEYWGETKGKDQRMVEMCPISFGLIMAKDKLYDPLSEEEKVNLQKWLGAVNDKKMPDTNWLWFRVLSNLALRHISSAHFDPVRMNADLDHLDTFQLRGEEGGWSRDGPEGVRQLDYYSGSFAIMFSQLVYSKICEKEDPDRCANYRRRALRFCLDLVHYFDDEGRCIPFGRSMIYRFAVISTFSVLPFAFDELPASFPLKWGHIKGLVLRHLRWWSKQEDIFRSDGTLSVGYGYENMYMAENYNGFGSPYWCTKAFACLSVPDDHPFWTSEELPWPHDVLPSTIALEDPSHIMIHTPTPTANSTPALPRHTYLLSSGQHSHYALKALNAKYGKFAYSSAFGFSCPTGSFGLEQLAGDSMLALCDDEDGEGFGEGENWRTRRVPVDASMIRFGDEEAQVALVSGWRPWADVEVKTWLIPPTSDAAYYHLRIHRLTTARKLRSAEAGWSTYGQGRDGRALVQVFSGERSEGGLEDKGVARAATSGGVVGVRDLSETPRPGKIIQGDPNSNIIFSRSVIPSLMGAHDAGSTTWLVTAVFGVPGLQTGEELEEWLWLGEWEKEVVVPEFVRKLMGGPRTAQ